MSGRTPYAETEVLLASMEERAEDVERMLDGFLDNELTIFLGQVAELYNQVRGEVTERYTRLLREGRAKAIRGLHHWHLHQDYMACELQERGGEEVWTVVRNARGQSADEAASMWMVCPGAHDVIEEGIKG